MQLAWQRAADKTCCGYRLRSTEDVHSLLHRWCTNGHVDMVRALLNHAGVDANRATTDDGVTPLFMAYQNGDTDVVRALLDAGARAKLAATARGRTWACMEVAQCQGHAEVIALLEIAESNTPSSKFTVLFLLDSAISRSHRGGARLHQIKPPQNAFEKTPFTMQPAPPPPPALRCARSYPCYMRTLKPREGLHLIF